MSGKPFLPGGKWSKHRLVARSAAARGHLPETARYSRAMLEDFLKRYAVAFVKPEFGTGGRDIVQLRRLGETYQWKEARISRTTASLDQLHRWAEDYRRQRRYLIQQGIELAFWKGRPVDLRTIVQRNRKGRWEVTGLFARIAGKQLAVTNVSRGGTAHRVESYLEALGHNEHERSRQIEQLEQLSLDVASSLGSHYANAVYGLDIGLDQSGKFWLIEVNTVPHVSIFRRLKFKRMYARSAALWNFNRTVNDKAKALANKKRGGV